MKITNLFVLLLLIVIIIPASATVSLSGTTKFMETLSPGQNITFPITLTSDSNIDCELELTGFTNDNAGGYININDNSLIDQTKPKVTLEKTNVHLEPKKPVTINAEVTVPNICNNNLYALINIHPKSTSSTGTSIVTAINIPVMITVNGVSINETGIIISTQLKNSTIITVFRNTGNHHYYGVTNDISVITNGITSHYITKLDSAIVPGGKIIFKQTLNESVTKDSKITSSVIDSKNKILASSQIVIIESHTKLDTKIQDVNTSAFSNASEPPKEPSLIIIGIIILIGLFIILVASWCGLKYYDRRILK